MIYPHDFFPEANFSSLGDFFELNEPVWQAIAKLKERLGSFIQPNISGLPTGEPLPQTHILFEGELIPAKDAHITFGDATKGKLRVEMGNRVLDGASVLCAGAIFFDSFVEIGRGVLIEPGALIKGPTYIGNFSEVRQGAYIRGSTYVGERCVVGHTTEVKNSIMLNGAKAGHFAYLGDSILGHEVNLGAGTKLANLKLKGNTIKIKVGEEVVDTGLRKLGAILGDYVQTGCNSVTNPGTLIGPHSLVLPNTTAGPGLFASKSLIKS
ncbi:acyltransferase [Thermodesulfatator autotrophicus]|uniref:Mannose-1-phosphate guanyltransferase C-terminal domain-containing protein n=1 Tax=Thermodesulfatator autotrophicus TaxID=1795632 RepID=A0A177E671_9BACT|nr:hypothetical protein [Thermodesulfatator autotrophicus]OAG27444.1 hypothetical protein TH606_06790 [Thermodesulfatator autotrophicus]